MDRTLKLIIAALMVHMNMLGSEPSCRHMSGLPVAQSSVPICMTHERSPLSPGTCHGISHLRSVDRPDDLREYNVVSESQSTSSKPTANDIILSSSSDTVIDYGSEYDEAASPLIPAPRFDCMVVHASTQHDSSERSDSLSAPVCHVDRVAKRRLSQSTQVDFHRSAYSKATVVELLRQRRGLQDQVFHWQVACGCCACTNVVTGFGVLLWIVMTA